MKILKDALKGSKTIVFFDLEGTQFSHEIIAIGAIKVEIDEKLQISKKYNPFKIYVKSMDKIGSFVSNLVGIKDDFLEANGTSYIEALNKFQKYIGNTTKNMKFISYGNFDMALFSSTNKLNNIPNDDPFCEKIYKNYIDFSVIFRNFVSSSKNETLSLLDGLKLFKITPVKNSHDPQVDALNLMLLYEGFLKNKKILKEEYIKVLKRKTSMPRPIALTMSKLYKEGNVTIEDFNKIVEEEL